MTTATIQMQELSFAGAPPREQGAQEPSLSFQQLLGSSEEGGRWEEGESIADPMVQAADEKEKDGEQEVPQSSSSAAATLAVFAMANPQGAQVSQTAQALQNTDSDRVQTAQTIPDGAVSGSAAGFDYHANVTTPHTPKSFSPGVLETQDTAPEGPVFQNPDASIGSGKEISAENETQLVLAYTRAAMPKEVLHTGGRSEQVSPLAHRGESALSHVRTTAANVPLGGSQKAESSAQANSSTQADKTADLQLMQSAAAGQEREPLKAPQASTQPSIPQKTGSTRTVFVQGSHREQGAAQKAGESEPSFESSVLETHAARAADAFIPLQRRELTPEEKPKTTGEQSGQASAASTPATTKPQPLPDMREASNSEGTEIPLAAEQISQSVQKAMKENATEFCLKLKPEGLGQVTVRVRGEVTEGKRNIVLDIRAESGATQKLISEQVGKLTADLCAGRYDSVDVRIGAQVPDSSLHSGFSREGTGQNHGETRQFFGETLQQHKENPGMPLRFYRGGMLNCTA